MKEANLERLEDLDDCVKFSEANAIKDLKDMASVPQPPSEYVPPAVKTEKGEPKWEELDNSGDWSRYCFNPSFYKSGSYISHSLPTGAVPVLLDRLELPFQGLEDEGSLEKRCCDCAHCWYDRVPFLSMHGNKT
ncbi:hypothetical protein IV203_034546 [Nitzschia inconspicua]|uniref:Uncharacterized protein n=1 Tax=Nitzschia inconspicua TaxID=303405 RepID=A0A9K3LDF7_9STRA|nr:hypothetical protein IV203_034546 [Nitzschia inconspicua]